MLKNLSRVGLVGVIACLVLLVVLRGAPLDAWAAVGSAIGAVVYLGIRNYYIHRTRSSPSASIRGVEWTKEDIRYVEYLFALFAITPIYLLFLAIGIKTNHSMAIAWLLQLNNFCEWVKPVLPAQDLTHYLVIRGGTAEQTLILSHFAAVGQLGTFLATITILILSAGVVSRSARRTGNFVVPGSVLIKLAILTILFGAIWLLIGQSEKLFFNIDHDSITLKYGMIMSYFSLLPTAIGFWVWLSVVAVQFVRYRGLHWR